MERPNTWHKTSRKPLVHEATPPPIYTAPAKAKNNPPVKKDRKGWKRSLP